MTFSIDAIYEDGVLRPIVPLNLNEREVVSLFISTSAESSTTAESSTKTEAEKQRALLSAFVAKMEALPTAQVTPL